MTARLQFKRMPAPWRREIKLLVGRIARGFRPKRIIVFGSAARGVVGPHSDVDLLIVKNTRLAFYSRAAAAYRTLRGMKRSLPVDIFVYTERELDDRQALGDYFVVQALSEGKVVYEQRAAGRAR